MCAHCWRFTRGGLNLAHCNMLRYVDHSQVEGVFCQERIIKLCESEISKCGATSLQCGHSTLAQQRGP